MSATRLKRLRGGCGRRLLVVKRCGDGAVLVGRGKKWRRCIEVILVMGWWIFGCGRRWWWGIARRGGMICRLSSSFRSFVFCPFFSGEWEVGGRWMVCMDWCRRFFSLSYGICAKTGSNFLSRNAWWTLDLA